MTSTPVTHSTRAAVLRSQTAQPPYALSVPLSVESLTLPAPRANEVLVRIERASLCHSDLSVVNGSRPRPLPMALGHEAAGIVEAIGTEVTTVAPGDHVVLVFVPSCGDCRECNAERPALCSVAAEVNGSGDLLHGAAVLRDETNKRVNHHLGVSAFAERAIVAESSVVRIDYDVPFETAALFGCASLTGMGAVFRTAAVKPGQSVIVFGLGAVGLAAIMAAASTPDCTVIAIDPNAEKHALARAAGASVCGTPAEAAALVNAHCLPGGVDIAIEAVGNAHVIAACLELLARGGAVVSVGLPHPDQQLSIQALQFAGAGKRLLGSYMGDAIPREDIPRYVQLWRDGVLPVEVLYTDTVPLAEINEALDALGSGTVVRRLLAPR